MAIQFNANALNAFSNVNFGNDDAIANIGTDKKTLVQNGKLGSIFLKPFRSGETQDNNNAVRTELLKALGRAFNLTGFNEDNGTFTDQFMNRLEEILGPAFKRGDYGIKDGEVKSGKPLTQRRIMAIVNAAKSYAAAPEVNNVGAVANNNIQPDRRFEDVSELLKGKPIAEIVGGNRDAGWDERAGDLAVFAAKIKRSALTIVEDGAFALVKHGDVEVELSLHNGQINASVMIGEKTLPVRNLTTTREGLCFAMDSTVASLYDSFTEKKDGDLTHGRAILADKVLTYYKNLSQDDMGTKKDCPFRNFASGLLMTKARVTEKQIAKLTNNQLAEFVVMLCQAGDASGIKDVVESTIEEEAEEDEKLEDEVNNVVARQNQEDDLDNENEEHGEIDYNEANNESYIDINKI